MRDSCSVKLVGKKLGAGSAVADRLGGSPWTSACLTRYTMVGIASGIEETGGEGVAAADWTVGGPLIGVGVGELSAVS